MKFLRLAGWMGVAHVMSLRHIVLPLSWGGVASAALLSIVLCWNEAFWAINLTAGDAGTLTALIASYSSPEGLILGKTFCSFNYLLVHQLSFLDGFVRNS